MLAVLLFSVTALGIVACKKQQGDNSPVDVNQIEQLAQKFTRPIDQSYAAVAVQYSNLTAPELNQFWIAVNKITRHTAVLTTDEETAIVNWVADNNKKSVASFGKSFNRLTSAQLQDMFFINRGKEQPVLSVVRPPDPPPSGCNQYSYPLLFYPITSGIVSPAAASTFDVIDIGASSNDPYYPCAGIEYWYSGTTWTSMYPLTPLAATCMGYAGGWGWLVRKDGGYTKVFAPKTFVIGWFGSFAAFNDNVRVATESIVEQ